MKKYPPMPECAKVLPLYDDLDGLENNPLMLAETQEEAERALIANAWALGVLRLCFLMDTSHVNGPSHAAVVDVGFIRKCVTLAGT